MTRAPSYLDDNTSTFARTCPGFGKTQAQMAWAALGLNLLKAMRKLQSGRLQPCPGSSPS